VMAEARVTPVMLSQSMPDSHVLSTHLSYRPLS